MNHIEPETHLAQVDFVVADNLTGCGGFVVAAVLVHLDDSVRLGHEEAAGPRDHDRGDPQALIERAHEEQERSNGLGTLGHQRVHNVVAVHEVGGGNVLVKQQQVGAHFDGLHDDGSLRRGARGIGGAEVAAVLAAGKGADESGNVHPAYAAAVLSSHLHGIGGGHHKLPAVAWYLVVYSDLNVDVIKGKTNNQRT
ncbi:uncharacterized protein BcabD6B2_03250 [Babesia caballi]|uniref:Uncharacterized protein n=1 Tax=Babesia caballi TaxID=5871 RepID=A0AAV4LM23_BABCB|nr:hypothetical protein BcabD6B2_03250 [Babesia caballi]